MSTPRNDIVQLAAYRDLLTLDGGQSFSEDPLQYHLFMERINSGVLCIFGNSDPGVAIQIVIKSCSRDAFAAIHGCAVISDQALKQALDILSHLFGRQRRARFWSIMVQVCSLTRSLLLKRSADVRHLSCKKEFVK